MAYPHTSFEKLVNTAGRYNYWEIDRDTMERYFNHAHLTWWEKGRIVSNARCENAPDVRSTIGRVLGVEIRLVKELSGTIRTPDGDHIAKAWLENTPTMWDAEYNTLLNISHTWQRPYTIYYPHRDAQPVLQQPFSIRQPNKKRSKEVLPAVMDAWVIAQTQHKMEALPVPKDRWGGYVQEQPTEFLTTGNGQLSPSGASWLAFMRKADVEPRVKYLTSDVFEVPFLRIT